MDLMGRASSLGEPIIDPVRFVQATRDSGYRSLDAALSELLDNSLQAGATKVRIFTPEGGLVDSDTVAVLDNGCGMGPKQLRIALQFGGSERFNDRSGLGRYGMGLPNSSLSQARRVEVYSWRGKTIWYSYLDLDEVLTAESPVLPAPRQRKSLPKGFGRYQCGTGTLVIWKRLDKGKPLRWGAAIKRLSRRLGQVFRYFIWEGREVFLDNAPLAAVDPLFLSTQTRIPWVQGKPYGEPLLYEFRVGDEGKTSRVEVRFSELPIGELTNLPNSDKRTYGVTGGAGISVVRGGRELRRHFGV
ncbi:ATP-binding protein [Armatimonas sp.]|uniref:ATP-binding protein n=1 Tax=Armatimonas sp. TaxID=1872638 RepID=UPI003752843A